MKKNQDFDIGHRPNVIKLNFLAVKLFILFLFCGFVTGYASSYAQSRVTLSMKNASLEEIFEALNQQTQYGFVFSNTFLAGAKRMDVQVSDMELKDVLKLCLEKTNLGYKIENSCVVISPILKAEDAVVKPMTIKGVVKDVQGETLPGVTVLLKGSTTGVSTDIKGEFQLTIPEMQDVVLVFSYIGMKTQEVKVKKDQPVRVVMEMAVNAMEEVVVNGMFTQNKNSYTGAVTTIKSEDILSVSNTNLLKAISILSPGLRLVENNEMGANPNHIPELIIRGTTSIASQGEYGLNTPLIILDGVEISLTQLYDLDIYEIERVDVLKDASATSIYGEKAANGVIVIERKRVTDRNLRLRYSFVPNFEFPDVASYHYCDARQKLELERLNHLYESADGTMDQKYNDKLKLVNRGVNTNWMAKPLRNSTSFSHSLNMTGRGGGMDYGVTARFSDKRGVMKGDYRNNYGLAFYFSYRLLDRLTITYRADLGKTDTRNSPYGNFAEYVKLNPYDTPYNEYGEWNKLLSYDFRNPLYDATTNSFDKSAGKNITNSLDLRWDIWKGFYVTGSFNYALSDSKSERFVSPDHSSFESESDPTKKGEYSISASEGNNWQARAGVTYSRKLDDKGSILTINVGGNISKNKNTSYNFMGVGFLKSTLTDMAFANSYPTSARPGGSESLNANVGVFANLNMIWLNRYFVDGSYRVSGSSKFGKERRFAPFWSVGVGWNIHNEPFVKALEVFDIFRVRGSYGYTGSVNFSDYQAVTTYRYSQDNNYYIGMGAKPITMGNDRLKWQTTIKYNAGFTAEMLGNRVSVNFDWYKENTTDLLIAVSTPPSVGVDNVMDNLGETGNWGYEWSISGLILKYNQFYWRLGISGHHTENKLKKISNSMKRQNNEAMKELGLAAPKIQLEEGESATAIYSVPSLGIDPATGQEIFVRKDGSYTFVYNPQDKVALGNTTPYVEGALTTSLGYKGFSLSASMTYTFGGDIYNTTRAAKIERINPKENVDVRAFTERWKHAGDLVYYTNIAAGNTYVHSQRFIERKNEVYLSSVNLSYEFKPEWVKKIGLNKFRVGVGFSDVLRLSTVRFERGTSYPYSKGYNFTISPTF